MRKATITGQGIHPLFLHHVDNEGEQSPATVEEACRQAIRFDDEGFILAPARDVFAGMTEILQREGKDWTPNLSVSYQLLDGDRCMFSFSDTSVRLLDKNLNPIPYPQKGEPVPWTAEVRRGETPNGQPMCLVYAKISPWHIRFDCAYDEEISHDTLLAFLKKVGLRGLGAYRPTYGGRYGMWKPTRIDEVTLPRRVNGRRKEAPAPTH